MSHAVHADAAGEAGPTARRTILAQVTLAVVALSVLAMLVMVVGNVAGWKGFSESETDNSAVADAIWITFSLGMIVALILGIVTFVRSRSGGRGADRMAGIAGMAWFGIAIVLIAIVSAID